MFADQRGAERFGGFSGSRIGCGITPAQKVAPFSPDSLNLNVLARLRLQEARRGFQDVGIERSRQTLIAGNDDQQNPVLLALRQKRMLRLTSFRIENLG